MRLKVYLAGPEVFLPNALEHAEIQRKLCLEYGFEPLHPMDNALDLGMCDMNTAHSIRQGNIEQIKKCDLILANCNPFRGICMDDGTAYELGFAHALGKMSFGYVKKIEPLQARTIREYSCSYNLAHKIHMDNEGYAVVADFGTSINLMMECGGRLIEGNFETCLKAMQQDIQNGIDEYRLKFA